VRLIWAGKNLTILAPDGTALRRLAVAADLVARVDGKVAVEAIAGVLNLLLRNRELEKGGGRWDGPEIG